MSKSLKISKTAILKALKFENQLNFAKMITKNLAKIEKLSFWEPQNMKISQAKIQKSVGKKSGQLLSRDRSTQNQISQTVLLRVVSLVSNLANHF